MGLELDDQGYLDPIVYDVKINFGDSNFEHENWFISLFMQQFLELGIVVVENSAWLTGKYMFSNILGPIADKWLNDYSA